jgi:ribose 1,5-bisphosphokinase PhnN
VVRFINFKALVNFMKVLIVDDEQNISRALEARIQKVWGSRVSFLAKNQYPDSHKLQIQIAPSLEQAQTIINAQPVHEPFDVSFIDHNLQGSSKPGTQHPINSTYGFTLIDSHKDKLGRVVYMSGNLTPEVSIEVATRGVTFGLQKDEMFGEYPNKKLNRVIESFFPFVQPRKKKHVACIGSNPPPQFIQHLDSPEYQIDYFQQVLSGLSSVIHGRTVDPQEQSIVRGKYDGIFFTDTDEQNHTILKIADALAKYFSLKTTYSKASSTPIFFPKYTFNPFAYTFGDNLIPIDTKTTLEEVTQLISQAHTGIGLQTTPRTHIFINGPSCSGKSTLTDMLCAALAHTTSVQFDSTRPQSYAGRSDFYRHNKIDQKLFEERTNNYVVAYEKNKFHYGLHSDEYYSLTAHGLQPIFNFSEVETFAHCQNQLQIAPNPKMSRIVNITITQENLKGNSRYRGDTKSLPRFEREWAEFEESRNEQHRWSSTKYVYEPSPFYMQTVMNPSNVSELEQSLTHVRNYLISVKNEVINPLISPM